MDNARLQAALLRIENLRALAAGTHSAEEAETALKLAARIQAQFRLEEVEEIVAKNFGRDTEEIDVDTPVYLYETLKVSYWRNNLAYNIAALSGVYLHVEKSQTESGRQLTRYRVIGKRSNVEMAVRLFEHLVRLVPEMAAKEIAPRKTPGINPAKEAWCNGCIQGYAVKMKTERDAVIQTGSFSAIAILDNQSGEAERAFKKKMDTIFEKNTFVSRAKRDYSAEYAGFEKGQRLSVDAGGNTLPSASKPNQLA